MTMCSGCGNRHDPDRCPHGVVTYDEPDMWLRRALAEQAAERAYWEQDTDEED